MTTLIVLLVRVIHVDKSWPKGQKSVKVVYTAGYSATPDDLKLAVFDLSQVLLKRRKKRKNDDCRSNCRKRSIF